MALVIRATPSLVGEEAVAFLEKMRKNDSARLSKVDLLLLDTVKKNRKFFSSQV